MEHKMLRVLSRRLDNGYAVHDSTRVDVSLRDEACINCVMHPLIIMLQRVSRFRNAAEFLDKEAISRKYNSSLPLQA
jgi:hypothetical protein